MKIKTKFLTFIIIFILIVFAIMYFASIRISRNRVLEDIGNHINSAVKFKAYSIDELIKSYIEFTELISTGFPFIKYFIAEEDHDANEKKLKNRFNDIVKFRKSISGIRMLDKDGIVVISSRDDVGLDISHSKIFLEGKNGTFFNDYHYSEFIDKYIINIATPIYANGKVSGVLIVDFVAEEHLFPILVDKTGLTYSTNFFLLNKDFQLITPTQNGDKLLETKIYPEQIEHCHKDHLKKTIPDMDLVKRASYINYLGNKVMGTHIYIPLMQWFLIVEIDESDLMRPIMKNRNTFTILFSILLIISLGVSYIISKFLTKPIKQLEIGVQEIINGNTDYKVATNSKDEIGQLSRVFDDMTERLMKSQRELEDNASILEKRVIDRTKELEKKITQSDLQRKATLNVLKDLDKANIDLKSEIGERKQIEDFLRVERDNLTRIFETMDDGIYLVNEQYDIIYVNSILVKDFGSYKDKKCYKYFHDLNEPCSWCKNPEVFAGKTVHWEWTSAKNGKIYSLTDTPLYNPDGSIYKLELFHDITNRKLAEREITKLSTAVTQSPSVIAITNLEGNLEYVNPKFTELTGYTIEEAKGMNPRILKSGEQPEEIYKLLWETISSGKVWRGEFHNKKKNGEFFWESASISPIHNKNGEIINFVKVAEDITERKEVEKALIASEEKLRMMINNSPIGFSATDLKGSFIDVNPAVCKMTGYAKEELINKHFDQFSHPDDKAQNDDLYKKLLENKIPHFDLEKRYIHKDGSIINVLIRSQIVRDEKGKPLFEMAITEDITKRKIAEEQIEKDLKEKTVLLQEIYHRTKNNMQVVASMIKIQTRNLENRVQAGEIDADFIYDTFNALRNKITAMSLVHEKLYQAKDLSNINLKDYIEDLIHQLRLSYSLKAANISLKFELKDVFILIDSAIPLGLVLNELISNIFKHAYPNNEKGEICVRLYKEDGAINIHLSDNGVGIPSDIVLENANTMGLQTVFSLTEYQLNGEVKYDTKRGLKWHIKFNDDQHKARV